MVKSGKIKTRKTSNKFTILVAQVVKNTFFVMIKNIYWLNVFKVLTMNDVTSVFLSPLRFWVANSGKLKIWKWNLLHKFSVFYSANLPLLLERRSNTKVNGKIFSNQFIFVEINIYEWTKNDSKQKP